MDGYFQVYTRIGKGEITAALGLSIRAAGAGLRVFIGRFVAPPGQGEIDALKRFSDRITTEWFGEEPSARGAPTLEDGEAARSGLEKIKTAMASGEYDMVIMEEGNTAVGLGLFSAGDLLDVISSKPRGVELVVTGRDADPAVLDRADLVSEIHQENSRQ